MTRAQRPTSRPVPPYSWSLVALGLLLVALWAPSAEGKSHGKKPGKVINVPAASNGVTGVGAVVTETALCPAKTRAVGGGFLGGSGIVFESRMVGVNAWRVSAQNRTDQASGLVTYAYCRKRAPKTIAVSQTSIAGAAGAGPSAIAKCPRGRKAVAGGFTAGLPVESGLVDNVVTDSLRLGADRWRTQVLTSKAGAIVTGFAYCAKRKKAPPARTGSGPTVTGDLTPTTAVSPSCGNQTAVMGGFSQVGATGFSVAFPAYTVSKRNGKTWHVSATNVGGGPLTVSATAYCG
jgi:hypothetical protein